MKISIIGGGNMGGAIARCLIENSRNQLSQVIVSHPSDSLSNWLTANSHKTVTTRDNMTAAEADIIILAVKPWKIENVLKEISATPRFAEKIIISIAAGITTEEMFAMSGLSVSHPRPSLFRVVPNTAVSLGESATFVCHNNASPQQVEIVCNMFSQGGKVFEVEESMISAVTALSSCGIAYILRYIDISIKGGMELGIEPEQSRQIVLQTVKGAVALLETYNTEPQTEIDKVTTPGGLTFKGLTAMTENGFEKAIREGLKASLSK